MNEWRADIDANAELLEAAATKPIAIYIGLDVLDAIIAGNRLYIEYSSTLRGAIGREDLMFNTHTISFAGIPVEVKPELTGKKPFAVHTVDEP